MRDTNFCRECGRDIYPNEFRYSVERFGIPLCRVHQDWIQFISTHATFEAIRLYFALKLRGVPAQIEKFNGHKNKVVSTFLQN